MKRRLLLPSQSDIDTHLAGGLVELLQAPTTNPEITSFLTERIQQCDLTCIVENTGSFKSVTDRMRAAVESERQRILSEGLTTIDNLSLLCKVMKSPHDTSLLQGSGFGPNHANRVQGRSRPLQAGK